MRLSTLAREDSLMPNDLRGATLIVSNIGSFGGDIVAPLTVAPMVGIIGLGRVRKVNSRLEMTISWSADHWVIDGASVAKAAKFLETILQEQKSLFWRRPRVKVQHARVYQVRLYSPVYSHQQILHWCALAFVVPPNPPIRELSPGQRSMFVYKSLSLYVDRSRSRSSRILRVLWCCWRRSRLLHSKE